MKNTILAVLIFSSFACTKSESDQFIKGLNTPAINQESPSPSTSIPEVAAPLVCPANFVLVPKNPAVGTTADFCVMQLEARNSGSNTISFNPVTPAWNYTTNAEAKAACSALGAGRHLITNQEWMTIARNIEATAVNWSSGVVNNGCIFSGNAGSTTNCTYFKGNQDEGALSGRNSKAKLTLSNGSEIWDFSGNLLEQVDWQINPNNKPYSSIDGTPSLTPRNIKDINQNLTQMTANTFYPLNANLTRTNFIGSFTGGNNGTGGQVLRGGHYYHGTNVGIYNIDINNDPTYTDGLIGFRCTYTNP